MAKCYKFPAQSKTAWFSLQWITESHIRSPVTATAPTDHGGGSTNTHKPRSMNEETVSTRNVCMLLASRRNWFIDTVQLICMPLLNEAGGVVEATLACVPVISHTKYFHHEFNNPEPLKPKDDKQIPAAVRNKYKVFRDEDSPEIFDVEEEKQRYQVEDEPDVDVNEEFLGLNLKRGIHGVFDVEDLVDVLRLENAEDIFVCHVPKEYKYVDYMVVVTGRSYRHMLATAEFVRRVFKKKCVLGDILPKIEGEKSRDWMAMDLGNIALHIFSPEARENYDLESLWSIGSQYDKETNKPQDPLVKLFEKHSHLLNDLKPHSQK